MFPSGRPLTSAELMFGAVNQTELWENPELLDLDCLFDLRDCGLLYSVLSGNQIIVGALTVADLTQHVFAVSGSLILLAMSSLVRNANVDFYFKRFRRRHKVHIIHVTPTNSGANIS
ncbi:hypothetical protein AAVH_17229 [Aphelenchoides avenae]|nr:hypothetical protein AAVH_17229 [Aphelenchus avenae]